MNDASPSITGVTEPGSDRARLALLVCAPSPVPLTTSQDPDPCFPQTGLP